MWLTSSIMSRVYWATHVLQWWKQRVIKLKNFINLKKLPQFELFSETREYEVEIVSNHKLVCYGE